MTKEYWKQCKYCGKRFQPAIDSQNKLKPSKYCSSDCRRKQEYKIVYGVKIVDIDFKDKTLPKYKSKVNSNGVEWLMHVSGLETFRGLIEKE